MGGDEMNDEDSPMSAREEDRLRDEHRADMEAVAEMKRILVDDVKAAETQERWSRDRVLRGEEPF